MNFNEEQLGFYFEVGLAVTQWGHVEMELAGVVLDSFDPKEAVQAMAGFRSIENIRAKLQFISALLAVRGVPAAESATWPVLAERIQKTANKRNQLAHRIVLNDPAMPAGRRVMLLSVQVGKGAKSKRPQKYAGAVCLRDVVGYRLEFFALSRTIANFRGRLSGQTDPFPKSLEQAQRPLTIAQIRSEILAFVSPRPKPLKL